MKTFFTFYFLALFSVCNGQLRNELEALRNETGITSQQVLKLMQVDTVYITEMEDRKRDAETNYNSPRNIQLQHMHSLFRRLRVYKEVLTPEQFEKMKKLRFDIYRHKEWMAALYKKNKLPSIEQRVEQRLQELKSEH